MANKIGFIGGGQMGEAMVKGLLQAGLYQAPALIVAEPDPSRRKYLETTYKIITYETSQPLLASCNTVLLAVKPQVMPQVLTICKRDIKDDHLIITIAAGLPIAAYERILGENKYRIIRVMPNTPALVLQGASAICRNSQASDEDLREAVAIFNAVGKSVVLEEKYLDAVTGLSGSGPAYVFTFIDALIDAGLKTGLSRDVSEILAIQTVLGSVKLLEESKEHPAVLRSRVTSPGGTTIAGLHIMERDGFRGIIMDAVEAATNRAIELGK
jgi:pyrroline-5-carboxylate reductase